MKKIKKITNQDIVIYQAPNGAVELRGDLTKETIWATQAQIIDIFSIDQSVVSRHVKNIFKDGEIDAKSNMQKMHNANSDKPVTLYSLDVILAVGYRANSKKAIEFRKWATKTLREHIVKGYTINRKRIVGNYEAFMKAVATVRSLLSLGQNSVDTGSVLDLVRAFADTWVSLQAYDMGEFSMGKPTKRKVSLAARELEESIAAFRAELVKKGEAGDLFALKRETDPFSGIVGSVMQTFDGKDLYQSVEEKAAHLLYFMVKNHPFVDGNKRSGAFSFVWFLRRAGILDTSRLTAEALTALTLLIAESNPADKDKMTGLVTMLLRI